MIEFCCEYSAFNCMFCMYVLILSGYEFEFRCIHLHFRFVPVSCKAFLDIQTTIEFRFTLKHIRDMVRRISKTYVLKSFVNNIPGLMTKWFQWNFLNPLNRTPQGGCFCAYFGLNLQQCINQKQIFLFDVNLIWR